MTTLKCIFLERKAVTSKKNGAEYVLWSVLYQDKFGYKILDFFDTAEMKEPKFLQPIILNGFWTKKDDKWQFRCLGRE